MKAIRMAKNILFSATLFVCAQALWAQPELVVQEWHRVWREGERPQALAFSYGNKYLYTATSRDLKLWDVQTGLLIRTFSKGEISVYRPLPGSKYQTVSVNFAASYGMLPSLSGEQFIVKVNEGDGVGSTNVALCDALTGKLSNLDDVFRERWGDRYSSRTDYALSPDGSFVLAAKDGSDKEDPKISVYNSDGLKKVKEFELVDKGRLKLPLVSKGAKYCAVKLLQDNKINKTLLYDLTKLSRVSSFDESQYGTAVDFSYDNRYLAFVKDDAIKVYNIDECRTISFPNNSSKAAAKFLISNSNELLVCDGTFIRRFDVAAKRQVEEFSLSRKNYNWGRLGDPSPVFSHDGSLIAQTFDDGILISSTKEPSAGSLTSKLSDMSEVCYNYKNDFVLLKKPGSVCGLFDKKLSCKRFVKINAPYVDCAVFDDGLYCIDRGRGLMKLSFDGDEEIFTLALKNYKNAFSSSDDGRIVAYSGNDNLVHVCDVQQKKELATFPLSNQVYKVSPAGSFVYASDGKYDSPYRSGKNDVFDLATLKMKTLDGRIVAISSDDKICAVYTNKNKRFVTFYECAKWKAAKKIDNVFVSDAGFTSDGKTFALRHDDKVSVYDFDTRSLVDQIQMKSSEFKDIKAFFYAGKDRDSLAFVYLDSNNIIRRRSFASKTFDASMLASSDGDWITYTPEGYFNGSEGGIKSFVHVVDGLKVYPLDQLAEVFFRPDLVAAKIAGKDVSKAAVADLPKPKGKTADQDSALQTVLATGEPPLVQFANPPSSSATREVQLKFNVLDQGGGIGGVFISVNGKVVQLSGSTKKIEAVSKEKGVPFSPLVSLCAGENVIEAYATNSAGKIESRHAVAKIEWKGEEEKPNLHILAFGVNDYATTGVSKLKYAVPDAQSVVQKFSQKSGGALYGRVWTKALLDKDVTKPNIQACVDSMAKNVKADDVFVLYISGHGVSYQGDYYFISYDFDGKNISTAVSKDFLLNNCLSKIKASKTLLLLDTCNSGAIVSGGDSDTAFARLSRATGQAIIAASSDTQTAIEGYDGHGVFTYALLDALSGKADFVGDNKISLLELNLYVSNIVPMLSKLKWNHAQNPWYDLRKQDFVLLEK